MKAIYVLTAILVIFSLLASRRKTVQALRTALRRFTRIAPAFVAMLVLVAVVLYFVPEQAMVRLLAPGSRWAAVATALGLGSVSVMPGFIALPLGVVLAFLSSAGICRIPMTLFEASFLGWKFTAVRFAMRRLGRRGGEW